MPDRAPLDLDATSAGSDAASGTVRVTAAAVSLYNLNIANTYGHVSRSLPGSHRTHDLIMRV